MGSRSLGGLDCNIELPAPTYHSENSGPSCYRFKGAKVLDFCRWCWIHFAVTVRYIGVVSRYWEIFSRPVCGTQIDRVECAFAVRDVCWPTERSSRTIEFATRLLYFPINLAIMALITKSQLARGFYFLCFASIEAVSARFSFRSLTEFCGLAGTFIRSYVILSLLIREPPSLQLSFG